MHSNTVG